MGENLKSWVHSFLLLLFAYGVVQGHESRPLFIEVTETAPGVFTLLAKIPASITPSDIPVIKIPEGGKYLNNPGGTIRQRGYLKEKIFQLEQGINGKTIGVEYPVLNPSVSTIIKVSLLNGQSFNELLGPGINSWTVPEEENPWSVARQYTLLGIQHILEGWDHLLFLICLILIAGTGRKMLITITGFTIAHSITLALSALNIVRIPVPPVEAVIALSVVFLAWEIVRGDKNSLTYRYPITVSASFGLLHGFGFASVLSDIGLPQTEVVTSLLFFNVGVEVGQILFLLGVILAGKVFRWAFDRLTKEGAAKGVLPGLEKGSAYLAGSLAAFWVIERVAGFF